MYVSTVPFLFNISLDILTSTKRQDRGKKCIVIGNNEKLFLFAGE